MKNAMEFLDDIKSRAGQELGVADWLSFDQDDINAHGSLTGDQGPIHNDPAWCKINTPFGGTIVQGSLLLSTFTHQARQLDWPDGDFAFRLNYGFNRIRIITPVKTGQKFRGRFTLKDAAAKSETSVQVTLEAVIEGEGDDTPAIVAEWLVYFQFNS